MTRTRHGRRSSEETAMGSAAIALVSFACIFAGALIGLFIRSVLPRHHLNDDSKDVVKLGIGLIATLAALVLGLLVSSSMSALVTMNSELEKMGAKIVMLDRILASYGPETKEVRGVLRRDVAAAIDRVWPEEKAGPAQMKAIEASTSAERFQAELRNLAPKNERQRQLQAQASQIADDVAQSRWTLIEQTQQALPTAFIVVLLFWLTILFAGFGLMSSGNATVITVLFICAISVSGAIFLITEMNTPLTGIIKVSSVPLHRALENLGRN